MSPSRPNPPQPSSQAPHAQRKPRVPQTRNLAARLARHAASTGHGLPTLVVGVTPAETDLFVPRTAGIAGIHGWRSPAAWQTAALVEVSPDGCATAHVAHRCGAVATATSRPGPHNSPARTLVSTAHPEIVDHLLCFLGAPTPPAPCTPGELASLLWIDAMLDMVVRHPNPSQISWIEIVRLHPIGAKPAWPSAHALLAATAQLSWLQLRRHRPPLPWFDHGSWCRNQLRSLPELSEGLHDLGQHLGHRSHTAVVNALVLSGMYERRANSVRMSPSNGILGSRYHDI